MRIYAILIGLLLTSTLCFAQKQNNNWCFGDTVGITFNTIPISSYKALIYSHETAATMSNRHTGDLMFYTDGVTVWDATHVAMANGERIGEDTVKPDIRTSLQGAVIVPFVNDSNKYFIFTMSQFGSSKGTLRYSVVDMTLNGGLGDIIPTQKALPIDSGFTEGMTVMPACGGLWLVVLKRNAPTFYAYRIDLGGLNLVPKVSFLTYNDAATGLACLKPSPDMRQIALTAYNGTNSKSFVALHDFDGRNGVITKGEIIDSNQMQGDFYACEFSSDSKLLYVTGFSQHAVYQYDLRSGNAATIKASKKIVYQGDLNLAGIQIGPDSNIYITKLSDSLDMISNINAIAPGCTYTASAIGLRTMNSRLGLPQPVSYPLGFGQNRIVNTYEYTKCKGDTLTLNTPDDYHVYQWQDTSKDRIYKVKEAGMYWVTMTDTINCIVRTDYSTVEDVVVDVEITDDTTLCDKDVIQLSANPQQPGTHFFWNTGSRDSTIYVNKAGRYTLTVLYRGCKKTDEMKLEIYPNISINLGLDTQLCNDDKLLLPYIETTNFEDEYTWSDGSHGRSFTVSEPGTYYVEVKNPCQTLQDTITVTYRNCHIFFPSAFTPNGDGRNDLAHLFGDIANVDGVEFRVFNRWGEQVFYSNDASLGWDGTYKGQPADPGTYNYFIRFNYLNSAEFLKGTITLIR